MNGQRVIYSFNGILLSNKNAPGANTHNHELTSHMLNERSQTRKNPYDSIYIKF